MMLLMLLLDDETLEGQTILGRTLLGALTPLNLGREDNRKQLLCEVKDMFLESDDYWEGLASQRTKIAEGFDSLKKGKKDQVLHAYEQHAQEKGFVCTSPCVLQLVYANQARNHAVVNR